MRSVKTVSLFGDLNLPKFVEACLSNASHEFTYDPSSKHTAEAQQWRSDDRCSTVNAERRREQIKFMRLSPFTLGGTGRQC